MFNASIEPTSKKKATGSIGNAKGRCEGAIMTRNNTMRDDDEKMWSMLC